MGMKLENWFLQVENVAKVTNMSQSEIAFMKSDGTPYKILKDLRNQGKSWDNMKNKLQEVYISLVMEIHAATLIQKQQTKDQKLIDYISDFTPLLQE